MEVKMVVNWIGVRNLLKMKILVMNVYIGFDVWIVLEKDIGSLWMEK